MFRLGFVSSTFETRRPTGNLELVDLSLEKKRERENQNGSTMTVSFVNGASPVVKPSERPHMERPVRPVFVRSPDGKQMDREWSFWDQGENIDTTFASSVEDQSRGSESDSDSDSERDTRTMDAIAEKPCEEVGLPNKDEGFGRILQHLERIEGSVKDLKARVDDAKHRIELSEHEWEEAPEAKVAPSLSSPVMETMGREAPVMEERELRYSPPIADSDVHDVLSFRLWEEDLKPKRKSRRSSRGAFEELDLESALDLVAEEYANSKDLKLPLPISGLRRFRMRSSWGDEDAGPKKSSAAPKVEVRSCEEEEEAEDFNPSPCSVTCGLSPTSLFSDDQEPFQVSQNVFVKSCKSPRSVLSPKEEELDETSHSTSECSEEERQPSFCAYLYNDESSELESPMKAITGVAHRPFPAFTYNVRDEMGETSSSEEEEEEQDEEQGPDLGELEFFQEAAKLSHWLVKDDGGGVLDDSDLEFLLSPDLKIGNEEVKVPPEVKKVAVSRPKSWVPYVTGELEKTVVAPQSRAVKRSVNFAADLVKEIPYSPPGPAAALDKKPAPATLKPSLKRHEQEVEGPSIMSSRRRWRKRGEENVTSRRRGRVPCGGKLFSWPRKLSFKVSRGKGSVESDDESFGTSARRDAEQVRRILKGSQKRYSNLSVAEIMKEDFGK